MKNERFYPSGPNFDTSAGQEVVIRMGGRRSTFVLSFSEPIRYLALGLVEMRRFHAVLGRHLRLREAEEFKAAPEPTKDEPT